ncbi:hypothetical protein EDC01DRAFT_630733 [Geopyxis carbonaria]|nr:hypothetical protein EDC01DRAFT_630733 [Geopyxis carbonaria]
METSTKTLTTRLSLLAKQIADAEARLQARNTHMLEQDKQIKNKTSVLAQLDHNIRKCLGIDGVNMSHNEPDASMDTYDDMILDETVSAISIDDATWEAWKNKI